MKIVYTKENGGVFGFPKTTEYLIIEYDGNEKNTKSYDMFLCIVHEWYANSLGEFFVKKDVPLRKVTKYLEKLGYTRVQDDDIDDILQDLEDLYGIM